MDLTVLGPVGLMAWLIVNQFLGYMRSRNESQDQASLNETLQLIRELHKWHDVQDEEGVRLWYNRKSLETSLDGLSNVLEKFRETQLQQTGILEAIAKILEREHK